MEFNFKHRLVTGEEVTVTVCEVAAQFIEIGITTPISPDPARLTAIVTSEMPNIWIHAGQEWAEHRREIIADRRGEAV